ncbi:helix-turn-helix domain-containing protein [Mycobacterium colombiense]|uniref:helix-turn-helix domain-containing protein n=1 Tax=Mycobacterium colombiense TaxID=339268 RepID=UPI00096EEED0|nr:helix-turn-helix transcriptional regulator [Mycobacterium colombiense]OMC19690.1 hypothetical protein A5738_15085 [Mycobacterium colombiense]
MVTRRDKGKAWAESLHERVAQNIRDARNSAGMSAQDVADLTQQLGYGVSRDKIANYESRRKQGLDLTEFLAIAAALRVPPVTLIFGGPPDEPVQVLPGNYAGMVDGLAWLCGDPALADETITDRESYNARLLKLIRDRATVQRDLALLRRVIADFERRGLGDEHRSENMYAAGKLMEQLDEISQQITSLTEGDAE